MNDELIDLDNYLAPGYTVSLTTRHDDSHTGTVISSF